MSKVKWEICYCQPAVSQRQLFNISKLYWTWSWCVTQVPGNMYATLNSRTMELWWVMFYTSSTSSKIKEILNEYSNTGQRWWTQRRTFCRFNGNKTTTRPFRSDDDIWVGLRQVNKTAKVCGCTSEVVVRVVTGESGEQRCGWTDPNSLTTSERQELQDWVAVCERVSKNSVGVMCGSHTAVRPSLQQLALIKAILLVIDNSQNLMLGGLLGKFCIFYTNPCCNL